MYFTFWKDFSNSALSGHLDQITVIWSCLMHCRVFSSIPGFWPLVTNRTSKLWWPRMFPDIAKCPLMGKNSIGGGSLFRVTEQWEGETNTQLCSVNKELQLWVRGLSIPSLVFPVCYDQPRQHIKKQRHSFANKGPSSQGYGFSSGHVWMWELDCEESWAPKNWCFWTVV